MINAPNPVIIKGNITVTQKNNKPCIELRKITTNEDLIKAVVRCAFANTPILIQPTFTDKFESINSLIKKGIIYKKGDEYFFTL